MDTFSKLNVDPVEGAQIMRLAGINPDDLRDPRTFSKVRDIMGFFSGKSDSKFMISKLLTGKPGLNPIDHLWGYATLRQEYDHNIGLAEQKKTEYEEINKKGEMLKEQLYHYER